jgi:hypothetical protein
MLLMAPEEEEEAAAAPVRQVFLLVVLEARSTAEVVAVAVTALADKLMMVPRALVHKVLS